MSTTPLSCINSPIEIQRQYVSLCIIFHAHTERDGDSVRGADRLNSTVHLLCHLSICSTVIIHICPGSLQTEVGQGEPEAGSFHYFSSSQDLEAENRIQTSNFGSGCILSFCPIHPSEQSSWYKECDPSRVNHPFINSRQAVEALHAGLSCVGKAVALGWWCDSDAFKEPVEHLTVSAPVP